MIQHNVGKSDDSEKYQDKCVELFYQNVEKDDLNVDKKTMIFCMKAMTFTLQQLGWTPENSNHA